MRLFFVVLLALGSISVADGDISLPPLAALPPNSVILFQGDSITDGGRYQKSSDYNHIMGQSYAYLVAAEINYQYPDRNLNFINRGLSGNKVTDLAARWTKDTIDLKPDLLSILVGINDTLSNVSPEAYEQGYDKLLAQTLGALPQVRIVLCEPFVLPVGGKKDHYADILAQVKAEDRIVAQLGDKYHLPVVHLQAAFNAACQKISADHWSWDGVHPTYAGHALIAHEWIAVVDSFWAAK